MLGREKRGLCKKISKNQPEEERRELKEMLFERQRKSRTEGESMKGEREKNGGATRAAKTTKVIMNKLIRNLS